jgi:hypothetical protein
MPEDVRNLPKREYCKSVTSLEIKRRDWDQQIPRATESLNVIIRHLDSYACSVRNQKARISNILI